MFVIFPARIISSISLMCKNINDPFSCHSLHAWPPFSLIMAINPKAKENSRTFLRI